MRDFFLCALAGLLLAYCAITVASWDIDNHYEPHRTLVQWIYVNQIQHAEKMLHELW